MAQFRSNENPMFRSKFSEDIFKQKYAHHNCETWDALASVLGRRCMSNLYDQR
jgi:ribonucleoside-diphosphate reductase alpha chain